VAFGAHVGDVIEDADVGLDAVLGVPLMITVVLLIIITALYGLGLGWALHRGGSWARRPARILFPLWVSLAALFVVPYQVSDPWYAPAAWLLLVVSVAPSVALVIDARRIRERSRQRPDPRHEQPRPERKDREPAEEGSPRQ
jgi:hypothetical protein